VRWPLGAREKFNSCLPSLTIFWPSGFAAKRPYPRLCHSGKACCSWSRMVILTGSSPRDRSIAPAPRVAPGGVAFFAVTGSRCRYAGVVPAWRRQWHGRSRRCRPLFVGGFRERGRREGPRCTSFSSLKLLSYRRARCDAVPRCWKPARAKNEMGLLVKQNFFGRS